MTEYVFPSINELSESEATSKYLRQEDVSQMSEKLKEKLLALGLDVRILDCHSNSFAVLFKIQLGEEVTRKAIRNLSRDLELAMGDQIEFRDDEQNEKVIHLAVCSKVRPIVALKDILRSRSFLDHPSRLAFGAGEDLFGGKLVIDLAEAKNLLITGVTGMGKSILLSDMIISILFRARPDEVQFLFFDFKGVDLPLFNDIPHQVRPSVKDPVLALEELARLERTAKKRLEALDRLQVDTFEEFNQRSTEKMPDLVLVIDEYRELVQGRRMEPVVTGKEFIRIVQFLASTTEKTGIHLILATQRISTDVVTNEIREAIPRRVSFFVSSDIDSRIAINQTGAQRLGGIGDCIYTDINSEGLIHAQAAYVTDFDIGRVVRFCQKQWEYSPDK